MFKWIKKKITENIVKEVLKDLPNIKEQAIQYFLAHKEEVLKAVWGLICSVVASFFEKKVQDDKENLQKS